MLTVRDHQSGDLLDPWEYLGPQRRKLLERSWAGVFRDYLLQRLPVNALAASFRDDFGRPRKDLHVALGALILQQLHDLTDQQTTEAVALNIAWHDALDVRREPDAYLFVRCPTGRAPVETSVAEVRIQALFDSAACQACPRRLSRRCRWAPRTSLAIQSRPREAARATASGCQRRVSSALPLAGWR